METRFPFADHWLGNNVRVWIFAVVLKYVLADIK